MQLTMSKLNIKLYCIQSLLISCYDFNMFVFGYNLQLILEDTSLSFEPKSELIPMNS